MLGFNENGIGMTGYGKFASKIPQSTKDKITQLIADIKAGKIHDLPKAD